MYEMAYRRRQGITRASTFKEDIYSPPTPSYLNGGGGASSLAAQAIRASAAHRDSSLSSAYGDSAFHSSSIDRSKGSPPTYDYTSMKSSNEAGGFWGVLARKAKSILDDKDKSILDDKDAITHQFHSPTRANSDIVTPMKDVEFYQSYHPAENSRKMDNPRLRKGLDALTSSLNHIGDTIGNALEEGRTIVESKTADIIQETRRLQSRRRGANFEEQNQASGLQSALQQSAAPHMQTSQEDKLKASRDVRWQLCNGVFLVPMKET